ncbi:MAG: flagellar biosynthetic protein FliO [Desulfobacula sp.]|nr:flagellar biosynthetic protein FliO [Desulfobacula sp.]
MSSTSDIWFAFARTFSVFFVVLALLILVFYMIKRISAAKGVNGSFNHINVLSMHHFSPKEKLVLLDVLGETILIGVTSNHISKLSSIETDLDFSVTENKKKTRFSDYLGQKLSGSGIRTKTDLQKKGQ